MDKTAVFQGYKTLTSEDKALLTLICRDIDPNFSTNNGGCDSIVKLGNEKVPQEKGNEILSHVATIFSEPTAVNSTAYARWSNLNKRVADNLKTMDDLKTLMEELAAETAQLSFIKTAISTSGIDLSDPDADDDEFC